MISSQRPWPLDHEAGQFENYKCNNFIHLPSASGTTNKNGKTLILKLGISQQFKLSVIPTADPPTFKITEAYYMSDFKVINVRALINNSLKKTNKYNNVKFVFSEIDFS